MSRFCIQLLNRVKNGILDAFFEIKEKVYLVFTSKIVCMMLLYECLNASATARIIGYIWRRIHKELSAWNTIVLSFFLPWIIMEGSFWDQEIFFYVRAWT